MDKFVLFDPRDLIMPPLRNCAKCGTQELGVVSVAGDRYRMRCRNCLEWQTGYLPAITKRIVYLDQFAISNLAKAKHADAERRKPEAGDPFWVELYELLDELCLDQLVVCPASFEHQKESLLASFYPALKRTYEHFSGGVTFYASTHIQGLQLFKAAEGWYHRRPAEAVDPDRLVSGGDLHCWWDRVRISVDADYSDFVPEIEAARAATCEHLVDVFNRWRTEKRSFAEWAGIERDAFALSRTDVRAIQRAFSGAGLQGEEVRQSMIGFAKSWEFRKIPCNVLSSLLWASFAVKAAAGQKREPDEGTYTDMEIMAMLIPYCDAMFVDNFSRSLYDDIPEANRPTFTCRLFSQSNKQAFLQYLESIRDSATEYHLMAVRNVYGRERKRPSS